MIKNKIVSISDGHFLYIRKEVNKVIEQLDLDSEKLRIDYKYTISGNNMLITISGDFDNLVNDRSQQKRDDDYYFIKKLKFDFCFIHIDILNLTLEEHSTQNYGAQDLTSFIQGKEYNSGYNSLLKNSKNIKNFVLVLTLKI